MRKLIWISLVILLVSNSAKAELHRCSGVWTNRDCSAEIEVQLEETIYNQRSELEQILDRKKLLLLDLNTKLYKARRLRNLTIHDSRARSVCLKPATTLEECQQAIFDVESQLLNLLALGDRSEGTSDRTRTPNPPESENLIVINRNSWWCWDDYLGCANGCYRNIYPRPKKNRPRKKITYPRRPFIPPTKPRRPGYAGIGAGSKRLSIGSSSARSIGFRTAGRSSNSFGRSTSFGSRSYAGYSGIGSR